MRRKIVSTTYNNNNNNKSPNLFRWLCIDIVRSKLILDTLETLRVKLISISYRVINSAIRSLQILWKLFVGGKIKITPAKSTTHLTFSWMSVSCHLIWELWLLFEASLLSLLLYSRCFQGHQRTEEIIKILLKQK